MPGPQALLLIKEQLLTGHESHYAGGIHLFTCMVNSLARSNQFKEVHAFTSAKKALVMHNVFTSSQALSSIRSWFAGSTEVISWDDGSHGTHCHAVIQPEGPGATPTGPQNTSLAAAGLLCAVSETASQLHIQSLHCLVLLDADALQHALVPQLPVPTTSTKCPVNITRNSGAESQRSNDAATPAHMQPQPIPFMLALLQSLQSSCSKDQEQKQKQLQRFSPGSLQTAAGPWPPEVVVLVQNLHHLPFGPCGTAARSRALLRAWQQVAGIVCVSHFVSSYLKQHALPLLCMHPSQVLVMHPAAFGVFGQGAFRDLGPAAAARIWGPETEQASRTSQLTHWCGCSQSTTAAAASAQTPPAASDTPADSQVMQLSYQSEQQQLDGQRQQRKQHQQPVVGMLKLTAEKGSEVFFSLAAQLSDSCKFLAVCADPQVQQQAAAAGLTHVELVAPVADVTTVLEGMSLLLVPSVLHEAFGMVVLDAMLRGIPVLVSQAGALSEAAAGAAAAVLPVAMVEFPVAADAGTAGSEGSQHLVQSATSSAAAAGHASSSLANSESKFAADIACKDRGPAAGLESIPSAVMSSMHGSEAAGCVDVWLSEQQCWAHREFQPQQQECLNAWQGAVLHVLSSREVYTELSTRSRAVAQKQLQVGDEQLHKLLQWLMQLSPQKAHVV